MIQNYWHHSTTQPLLLARSHSFHHSQFCSSSVTCFFFFFSPFYAKHCHPTAQCTAVLRLSQPCLCKAWLAFGEGGNFCSSLSCPGKWQLVFCIVLHCPPPFWQAQLSLKSKWMRNSKVQGNKFFKPWLIKKWRKTRKNEPSCLSQILSNSSDKI